MGGPCAEASEADVVLLYAREDERQMGALIEAGANAWPDGATDATGQRRRGDRVSGTGRFAPRQFAIEFVLA